MEKNGDHFPVPKSGPRLIVVIKTQPGKWALFCVRSPPENLESSSCSMVFQATALWRWSNYLQHLDPPQKVRVLINVDETSVRLVPEDGKGHISNRAYRLLCSGVPMGRNASLAAQRSAITHVTAICDHPEIQNRLPQVVLVGENQLNAGRASRLLSEAPASVRLWRQKKAWMTSEVMLQYILLLGQILQEFQSTHRFILYLDALRAHVSPRVLRAASRVNLWICVIPSKMTWALQPCDTHVFASYKRLLGEEYQRRSGLTDAGDITWELLLGSLWHVLETLVQAKDWSPAFDSVGIRCRQRCLSERTRRKLQYPLETPQVQASLPPLSDFQEIWPKGVHVPIHELFLPVERYLRGPQQAQARLPPLDERHMDSWFGRTRSTSALVASLPPPVVRPEPCPAAAPPPPTTAPPHPASATESARSAMPPPGGRRLPWGRRLAWPRRSPST